MDKLRGILIIMLLAIAAVGCRTAQVAEPLTQSIAGSDEDTQIAFWHTLAERKLTSNDEAMHGMLLFLDQEDPAEDYQGRMDSLKSRGLLPEDFDRSANESISRGTLAVMLVNALEIEGGLMLRLLPRSPRYATRELQYVGLYPRSSPNQTFSGPEFLGIIGRAEDYQRIHPVRRPAKLMPDEAGPEGSDLELDTGESSQAEPL